MRMEILKKILPVIVLPMIVKVLGPIKKIYQKFSAKFANDFHEYNKHYRERHGQLKVFCVGMQEPIPLDNVYVVVQFLDRKYKSREDIERAFREDGKRRFQSSSDKRQNGMKIANDKQYLMVLGGPGVGKSTFLRKVGLEALKGKEGNFAHECTPVFLELKRCTDDSIDIEALIADEFKTCGYPHPERRVKTTLKSGKLLILLDGLDEVPTMNVDNVIRKIEDFVDQYSQNRFIASCRAAAYARRFKQFTDVEIAEFDDSQIKAYIDNWFTSTSDPSLRQLDAEIQTAERCWKALTEHQHEATKELARNPLLLTLLCMVYDDLGNLPGNRVDLYEKVFNVVLKEWEAEKGAPRDSSVDQYLNIPTEKRLLYEIAMKNFEMDRVFFSENELVDHIQEFGEKSANIPPTFDASKILETIVVEQGLFVERVSGVYSFFHLTFQEYLTANYIVENVWTIQGSATQYLHDDRWREVFLLATELMPEADDLLVKMKAEAAKSINTPRLKALFQWAKRITNTSDDRYDGAAKRAFAIRQYFSLWVLNKIYGEVKNTANPYPSFDLDSSSYQDVNFYRDLTRDRSLYGNFYLDFNLCLDFSEDLDLYLYLDGKVDEGLLDLDGALDEDLYLDQNLNRDLRLFLNLYRSLSIDLYPDPDFNFYQDLYRYTGTDFYPLVSSKFGDRFDSELGKRIALVKLIEQAKIFKGVDLQRMVWRFNEQRKYVNAAREGKSVKPPEGSIHDTWLSVLHITDDMLAISRQEMESYVQYLRAVQLIIECKEAAGCVTPKVWEQIEDQLLTWDVEDTED